LFENGVIVPMRGSLVAQRRSACNQSPATTVSELSSTTSARDRAMPRFAVCVKPRLRSFDSNSSSGSPRAANSAK
jgi:hypothetical protein